MVAGFVGREIQGRLFDAPLPRVRWRHAPNRTCRQRIGLISRAALPQTSPAERDAAPLFDKPPRPPTVFPDPTLAALWTAFDAGKLGPDKGRAMRDRLVAWYERWAVERVDAIWRKRPGEDQDDMRQDGLMGLCKAIALFDPALGFQFETRASREISWAVAEGIRSRKPVKRSQYRVGIRPTFTSMSEVMAEGDQADAEFGGVLADPDSEQAVAAVEARDEVAAIRQWFDGDDQAVAELIFLNGRKRAEVADLMELPMRALDTRIAAIKATLEEMKETLRRDVRVSMGRRPK